jgi:predicted deacetylase
MRRSAVLIFLLFIILLIAKGGWILSETTVTGHTFLHGLERLELDEKPLLLWIEVHDVSSGYGEGKLNEITNVFDRHRDTVDKIVLFVIPNHGGNSPISGDPEFTDALKKLSDDGYILGIHGYSHTGGLTNPEFKTDLSAAKQLVKASREEFESAGIEPPEYFTPPGWYASREASKYLRSEFNYTYYAFFIDTPGGTLPYRFHEYTWYDLGFGGLRKAKKDFTKTQGIFRLVVHVNAANSNENMEFLDQFLTWIEEGS